MFILLQCDILTQNGMFGSGVQGLKKYPFWNSDKSNILYVHKCTYKQRFLIIKSKSEKLVFILFCNETLQIEGRKK